MSARSSSGGAAPRHPVVRFFTATALVAAIVGLVIRWLRGPATDAFDEPLVWPPATPWPELDPPPAEQTTGPPADTSAGRPSSPPRRKVQVVKKSAGTPEATPKRADATPKRTVRARKAATASAPPPGADSAARQSGAATGSAQATAAKAASAGTPTTQAWAEPVEGACPPGFPIKAKARSGLYHEPGMFAYERTNPDRCYPDGATAEADGYRRAKR